MTKFWISRAIELLDKSLSPPHELNELDWKSSLDENTKKLSEHLSAFGNQIGGGFFAFGISDRGEKVGLSEDESKKIISRIGSIAHDSIEPALSIDHHYFNETNGKSILIIFVQESKVKPVHLRGKGIEHSYIRTASSTRKMSNEQLANALVSSKIDRFEDIIAFSSNNKEEVLSLLESSNYFDLIGIPQPSSQDKILFELEKRKLLCFKGEFISITNQGVLLAAKDFNKFSGFERKGVRVIIYNDTTRTNAQKEMTFKKGYAVSFADLIEYIMSLLPSSELIKDALRVDTKIYPKVVIREILANAIIHQDLYNNTINPKIEIFSDRIEISNPGSLLPNLSVERIIDNSEPRNEAFARAMYQIGICEDRGSGIDRALDAIELYNLPPIKFEELPNTFKVTIYSPRSYQDMSSEERVRACYQHCVLKYLSNQKMTNQTLRNRLKISKTNHALVSRIIKQAVDEGKIKVGDPSSASTKFVHYIPSWA